MTAMDQNASHHAIDPRPQPPEPPLPSDCCDSGCDPCIHDLHGDAMARYRKALAEWQARHPQAEP